MRHQKTGRKLGVNHSHRKAMMRSLALSLIEHDGIKTTTARAKELRKVADRIVTLGKKGDIHSRRRLVQILGSTKTGDSGVNRVRSAVDKVFSDLAVRYAKREGGYTQSFKLYPFRAGDCADMSYIRYIPASLKASSAKKSKKKLEKEPKAKAASGEKTKKAAVKKKAAPKKAAASKAKKGPEDKGA